MIEHFVEQIINKRVADREWSDQHSKTIVKTTPLTLVGHDSQGETIAAFVYTESFPNGESGCHHLFEIADRNLSLLWGRYDITWHKLIRWVVALDLGVRPGAMTLILERHDLTLKLNRQVSYMLLNTKNTGTKRFAIPVKRRRLILRMLVKLIVAEPEALEADILSSGWPFIPA